MRSGESSNPAEASRPRRITREDARFLYWGDPDAGEVADWIFVSNEKVHQIMWSMAEGAGFRHSDASRTIYAADVFYHVLDGTLLLCNPATGEVHPVARGESAFFRRDTWHHGFNYGGGRVTVLQYTAPPPALGTTRAYASTLPLLEESRYVRDELLGRWPESAEGTRRAETMRVLRDPDAIWRLEGTGDDLLLVGVLVSTEHMTVGKAVVREGRKTGTLAHGGDKALYVLEGTLAVQCTTSTGDEFALRIEAGDGCHVPEGTRHSFVNLGNGSATFMFVVAPGYLVT